MLSQAELKLAAKTEVFRYEVMCMHVRASVFLQNHRSQAKLMRKLRKIQTEVRHINQLENKYRVIFMKKTNGMKYEIYVISLLLRFSFSLSSLLLFASSCFISLRRKLNKKATKIQRTKEKQHVPRVSNNGCISKLQYNVLFFSLQSAHHEYDEKEREREKKMQMITMIWSVKESC